MHSHWMQTCIVAQQTLMNRAAITRQSPQGKILSAWNFYICGFTGVIYVILNTDFKLVSFFTILPSINLHTILVMHDACLTCVNGLMYRSSAFWLKHGGEYCLLFRSKWLLEISVYQCVIVVKIIWSVIRFSQYWFDIWLLTLRNN
jgi:hypothetical protein